MRKCQNRPIFFRRNPSRIDSMYSSDSTNRTKAGHCVVQKPKARMDAENVRRGMVPRSLSTMDSRWLFLLRSPRNLVATDVHASSRASRQGQDKNDGCNQQRLSHEKCARSMYASKVLRADTARRVIGRRRAAGVRAKKSGKILERLK